MGARADAKDLPGVLRLLDYALATAARPDQVAKRLKARSTPSAGNVQNYYTIYTSATPQTLRSTTVDFPLPNAYFDHSAIYALRNAFEIFRKDDLASDLVARFRSQSDKAGGDAKLFPTPRARLPALVERREGRGAQGIRPGHRTGPLRRRTPAQPGRAEGPARRGDRGARSGRLGRAARPEDDAAARDFGPPPGGPGRRRGPGPAKAAERLFGLRLDAETQVQLATQMNQLGMHELSEAVLARARRRSGGNAQALASLMLQYQRQGKADVAIQVANQVLRQTGGARTTAANVINSNDQARAEAVQVFARSGKLKELIARAEAQLETSPTSQQLLQTLVDYYQADGQRDKVRATYKKIAALRPDDARLQMQIGVQLNQAGSPADSLDYFRAALKKEPSLFSSQYSQIQRAFIQARKADELAKILEAMDFKAMGSSPASIRNLLSNMLQNDQSRDAALALFRKAWKDLPDSPVQPDRLALQRRDLEAPRGLRLRPRGDHPPRRPARRPALGGDGQHHDLDGQRHHHHAGDPAPRRLESPGEARRPRRRGRSGRPTLARLAPPARRSWASSKARRGQGRRGHGAARAADQAPTPRSPPMPGWSSARNSTPSKPSATSPSRSSSRRWPTSMSCAATSTASSTARDGGSPCFTRRPAGPRRARDLILRAARTPGDFSMYDANYAGYQRVQEAVTYGSLLDQLGYPADAARFFSEISNDTQALEGLRQTYGGNQDPYSGQIASGLSKALQPMDGETLARSLRAILTPKPERKPGEPRLDLVLLCHPRDLDKSSVVCLFAETLKGAKGSKERLAEVREALDRLVATDPDDPSVLVASALFAGLDGNAEALAGPLDRLAKRVDAQPLEPLPRGGRANARQREEAATRLLILWVVAREASKHDATRSTGEEARRPGPPRRRVASLDNRWSLAMLREAGQDALDRGDKAAAEASWRGMLKLVMTTPTAPKPSSPEEIRTTVTTATGAMVVTKAANPSVKFAGSPSNAVVTLERFEQVAQFARLAATAA